LERYLAEGSDSYWRESAARQLGLLREMVVERNAHRAAS